MHYARWQKYRDVTVVRKHPHTKTPANVRFQLCVRPAHLEAVTQKVNTLRGTSPAAIHAVKTHCIRGHEFTPENTYLRPSGGRQCIECRNFLARRYRSNKLIDTIYLNGLNKF